MSGMVNVTTQLGYAAVCIWSQTSSKTTHTIAYNRSAMGKLFRGSRLILVWSVRKMRLLKNNNKPGPQRPNPCGLLNDHF